MFGLLRAAFTLLICVLVVGFFLGWFTFSRSAPDPQSNKVNINVSVDKTKVGSDLQSLEQKVSKGIQDFNSQPPAPAAPNGQASSPPRLSLGPLTLQPSGQPDTQPNNPQSGIPSLSLGPLTLQPSGQAPAAQPQLRLQTPDYQFTLPLSSPPPGEGR
jgi:hypothetical protein